MHIYNVQIYFQYYARLQEYQRLYQTATPQLQGSNHSIQGGA